MTDIEALSPWMDLKDCSEYLGLSPSYIRQMITEKRGPPCVRFGSRQKFHRGEVDAWALKQGRSSRRKK